MSGTFPTEPGYTDVQTSLKHYQLSSESLNGRIQVRSIGASRRNFTVTFPPMTRLEFKPIEDFIEAQVGMLETFQIALPTPDGSETVTVRLANDVQEFSVGVDNLYQFEVEMVEVLS